jgi:long-subunit fatty acid transport protein
MGVLVIATLIVFQGSAQEANTLYLGDALRFSTPGLGTGSRAIGMGGAFLGIANDYSALYWNPAGLAQAEYGEFSFGLSYLSLKDHSLYTGLQTSESDNSTTLNTLGLVFPVPVSRGSFVLAFGFNRESNFTTAMATELPDGFSTIQLRKNFGIGYAVNGDTVYADELGNNLPYRLYLADTLAGSGHWRRFLTQSGRLDSAFAYVWNSPINNHLSVLQKVFEGGGINDWSAGGALDIAPNMSLGVTLTYQSGSYKYDGTYKEEDVRDIYSSNRELDPRNFSSLEIADAVESDISGVSAKIGFMFREPDRFRVGVSIKTPTVYTVKETFGTTFISTPDFGTATTIGAADEASNEYEIVTPWVLGAGGSVTLGNLLVSADAEYTDWTEFEFRNANSDILALNRLLRETLHATLNFHGGAEYLMQERGLRLRGGFIYKPSPYQNDPAEYNQKYITAGLGIPLGGSTMLDVAYAHGWWETNNVDYNKTNVIFEKVSTNNIFATLSVRF